MIDPVLLDLVMCPVTHLNLRSATPEEVTALNAAITAQTLRTVEGEVITEPLDEALIRADGKVAYPVREDILGLLVNQGIVLS